MNADVSLVIFKLHEMNEMGTISGWCQIGETKQRFEFTEIDAYLLFDSSVY